MKRMDRRTLLKGTGAAAVAVLAGSSWAADAPRKGKGNIKQSVCRWCYGKVPTDKLVEECKKIGYQSIELLKPADFLAIKPSGLTCAVLNGGPSIGIVNCLNRVENHAQNIKDLKASIDFAAAEKLPNVICFSGNRKGMSDEEGLKNCAIGLKQVVGYAEQKNVTLIMELLNSVKDHKDYMCDKTAWGVELCQKVGSPRFKLLYDIYHMALMGEDVIPTIQKHHAHIGHYHTGGVPGRAEIDDTQTLKYGEIMKAIVATGYTGFVGQEFIPKRDPLTSMAQAFQICDV